MSEHSARRQGRWPAGTGVVIAAAAILAITTGARQCLGLFISPINTATGMGIGAISLAMAVGQFMWGASQPVFGAIADKTGSVGVVIVGGLMLALGTALVPWVSGQVGFTLVLGVLAAAGAGAGSFTILIGATSRQLPAQKRAFASGVVNAGGSVGQAIFAPVAQALMQAFGWVSAMTILAASTLATIPMAFALRHRTPDDVSSPALNPAGAPSADGTTLKTELKRALTDRSYLLLHAGFFTCGFHIAFLVTHLPGEVALCGLPRSVAATAISLIGLFNIAGSLSAGSLSSRVRMKMLLAAMYAARAVIIVIYLWAPKTQLTFYVFAAALGYTWLATVPPTAGLVGKLFGVRYLGTLFGLTLLSHQTGAFFGAWLGGVAVTRTGNYHWMWVADIALAIAAALLNLPIREAKVVRPPMVTAPV